MLKLIIFTLLIFLLNYSTAQEEILTRPISKHYKEYSILTHSLIQPLTGRSKVPNNNTWYYHFHKDSILATVSYTSGLLLHGSYEERHDNNNMRTKGEFHYGLKVGRWNHWHANGQLQKTEQWKDGQRQGKFEQYDAYGNLKKTGSYRKGQLHGKIKTLDKDQWITKIYKHGQLKENEQNTKENSKD